MASDSTTRFSNRTNHYIQSRPSYPPGMIDWLMRKMRLSGGSSVADIGSGTGISSKLLLARGCVVHAIEPNGPMRAAAEAALAHIPQFRSIDATAERTTLPDSSVDGIFCMQAFHWLDPVAAKQEWRRILRPEGRVALVWNDRRMDTLFLADYEQLLLDFGTDYQKVRHNNISGEALAAFFAPHEFTKHAVENAQHFDFAGLRGRLFSSSYAPHEDDPRSAPMLERLRETFDRHQRDDRITFLYRTTAFVGEI